LSIELDGRRGLPDRMWSHQETADFLGLPASTLHQMNSKRTGPRSYRVGRYRRYDPRDVETWLAGQASASPVAPHRFGSRAEPVSSSTGDE
jgi:predicted DNA-binding transcriptional regulator AlpA